MKTLSKRLNMRLAVGSPEGPRSAIWRIVSQKEDIYVSTGGRATAKLSFHGSGICRDAFNQEYGVPIAMNDRLMHKWRRAPVPDAETGRGCRLLRIWIATDFLSTAGGVPAKKVVWLPAAPSGHGRVFEIFLTKDCERRLVNEMGAHRSLVAYKLLPSGIAVAISTNIVEGSHEDFGVPASHHQKKALLISAKDPNNTGRPVRFFIGNSPKNGDCKDIWEFGGYYVDGSLPEGIGTFSRKNVLATQDTPTIKLMPK
jgi:hypothetical protein